MNQREYRIGPGAASLMLLVVVLSMSALGMLAMMSARSDESLSLRSQDVARQVAELNVSAEQSPTRRWRMRRGRRRARRITSCAWKPRWRKRRRRA